MFLQDLYSLLIGVKTSEELSKMASKIFNLKRQVQDLKKVKFPCVESTIREKLEAKSGFLNLKLKKNATTTLRNTTASHSKSKPAVLKGEDRNKYSRQAHKNAIHPRPTAQPLITKVMNVKLHHNKNYLIMKSIDVKGATKSNIENAQAQDQFVVNQSVPQNSYYQSSNFQNYNPYNMYWKKKM